MLQVFNVPAGGRMVNASADFFRYESCLTAGVDETLKVRADGNDLGVYLPGDCIELPTTVKNWELTPANATAAGIVRLGLGKISSSRIQGNVSIVTRIASNCQIANGGGGLTAIGFNVNTVLSPALNLRGCIVRATATSAQCSAAGTVNVQCIGAPSAPAAMVGITGLRLCGAYAPTTVYQEVSSYDRQVLLPPGWGIYFCSDVITSVAAAAGGHVSFEVL